MSLGSIFATAILPVVAIAGAGYALGRLRDVDVDPLNTVTVYVLVPALAFHSVATTDLGAGTLVRLAVGVGAFVAVMTVVAEGVGRLLGVEEPFLSALVLVSVFSNSGNYGIPLSEFAFGAVGRSTAVVYMTVQGVLMYTLGVYVAARSGSDDWRVGLRRVLTVPLVYAAVAGIPARGVPTLSSADTAAMETVGLVGNAAIPVMLVILGIELAQTDYGAALGSVGTATVLKMAVAPAVGLGVALALGFGDETVARVFVLESATPAAVTPLILLIEFGDRTPVDGVTASEFASTAVLVTTLVSVPLLTVLVTALQSGALL